MPMGEITAMRLQQSNCGKSGVTGGLLSVLLSFVSYLARGG